MMSSTDQIYALIYELIPLSISLIGFIICAAAVFKKKTQYFFTLIVFAVGCFVGEQVSLAVNTWCEVYDDVWVGSLGVFGTNLFLLSANYGALDKVVDETKLQTSKKLLSLIVPIILMISVVLIFLEWKNKDMLCAIVFALILIPAIPASYYNVKHLLLPQDELGILKATKSCNIMSLVFFFAEVVYLFVVSRASVIYIVVAAILLSLTSLGLSFSVVKGVKSWKI